MLSIGELGAQEDSLKAKECRYLKIFSVAGVNVCMFECEGGEAV